MDLVGKHGRVRTVPMPTWVKVAIDAWATATAIVDGPVFRSVNRGGEVRETALSEKVIWQLIRPYAVAAGELEQIQMPLGHQSVQTTECYLGTKQDLVNAPNHGIITLGDVLAPECLRCLTQQRAMKHQTTVMTALS